MVTGGGSTGQMISMSYRRVLLIFKDVLDVINGVLLRDAIISASNNLGNFRQSVDALNIFPVPDGDTGTNMSMTIGAAAREIVKITQEDSVSTAADVAASALLRGARGNSGVILSLIFRGIAKGLKGLEEANCSAVVNALEKGVKAAYKAVMKPTEGTMLTVIRVAAEHAAQFAQNTDDVTALWAEVCIAAEAALEKTPEQLPVLKKAGVVDAGGQGLVYILRGMLSVFEGNGIIPAVDGASVAPVAQASRKSIVGSASADIEFGYCSEFLIERDKNITTDPLKLRAYLESIGDCVVVVDDDSIIKVHVHSNEPGNVIQAALKYGQLINIKIDNMRYQHRNAGEAEDVQETAQDAPAVAAPDHPYGFVAVAAGEGVQSLFRDLGVDSIVKGGQTMNPSTEDILEAVLATPAQVVYVLPNNKNIILAAEQVIPLVTDRAVRVLHTKTIPQGISAMLNFDEGADPEANHVAMMNAAEQVSTGSVTFAARDSSFDENKISEGQIMGLCNGKITYVEDDIVRAAYLTAKHLMKRCNPSFVTLIFGNEATQTQAEEVQRLLQNKFGDEVEITIVDGGQPVYYFIISVE